MRLHSQGFPNGFSDYWSPAIIPSYLVLWSKNEKQQQQQQQWRRCLLPANLAASKRCPANFTQYFLPKHQPSFFSVAKEAVKYRVLAVHITALNVSLVRKEKTLYSGQALILSHNWRTRTAFISEAGWCDLKHTNSLVKQSWLLISALQITSVVTLSKVLS